MIDPSKRGWLVAVALLVSVFMAGVLTSAAVLSLLEARSQQSQIPFARPGGRARTPRPPGPMGGPGGLWGSEMLADRLGLSAEQEEAVSEILQRRQAQADSVMAEVLPRLSATLDSAVAEVRALLTAEQLEEFGRFRREGRQRLFERFPNPLRRGRGPPPRR